MRLANYDTKLIIWSDKNLLIGKRIYLKIENKNYTFKIFNVEHSIIEFGVFIPYTSLEESNGPIEQNLNDMLYYDTIYNYERFFSNNFFFKPKFIYGGEEYTLRMAGSGPIALKLILEFTLSELDNSNKPIEKKLRNFIVRTYEKEMEHDSDLENKFKRVLEKDKEDKLKKEERLKEIKKKEKRIREVEDEFDFYKPRDKSRYKIR